MSFQYPTDQGQDLGEFAGWEASRRHHRPKRGSSVFARLWMGLNSAFSTMVHGAKGNKSAWSEWLEEAPAWLVSVVVHFLLVVILGLCAVGVQKKMAEMEVEVAPSYNFSDGELGESIGSGLDEGAPGLLAEEFNPMLAPTPTISDLASDSEAVGGLVDVEGDWQELLVSADGNPSLMSGVGESPFGPGGGSGNGGDGNGMTSVFGLSGEGGKFVYAFDRSESMNSVFTLYSKQQILSSITPLASAKLEMSRSLGALGRANKFQIIFYNDNPVMFGDDHYGHELFSATEENKQRANEYIENMKAEGFTNHLAALDMAIGMEPNVIFLLTDGEAKDDLHPSIVRKLYKICLRKKILLNVIHFCNQPRENCTLERLAEKTGGQHIFIKLQDLAEALVDKQNSADISELE
jgi:hypothetical protein